MKVISHQRTMRFDADQYGRVEAIAVAQGRTIADIIRAAIDQYLLGQHLLSDSQFRQLRISEYSQLALDVIIREQFPDHREQIVTATDKRMSQYHGRR